MAALLEVIIDDGRKNQRCDVVFGKQSLYHQKQIWKDVWLINKIRLNRVILNGFDRGSDFYYLNGQDAYSVFSSDAIIAAIDSSRDSLGISSDVDALELPKVLSGKFVSLMATSTAACT